MNKKNCCKKHPIRVLLWSFRKFKRLTVKLFIFDKVVLEKPGCVSVCYLSSQVFLVTIEQTVDVIFLAVSLNPFLVNVAILYPVKRSEKNFGFLMVSGSIK